MRQPSVVHLSTAHFPLKAIFMPTQSRNDFHHGLLRVKGIRS
jgi:hypothetical protein